MLTINAEPEVKSPGKVRKKRRSKGEVLEEGEVLRMQDFPVRPPPAPPDISKTPPTPFSNRVFTRAASDRYASPLPGSPNLPWVPISDTHPPRTSSLLHNTPPSSFHAPRRSFEKPHPLLPHERPLPPLPPDKHPPHADVTPPPLPRGIVVTPSSPHKPTDFEVVQTVPFRPQRRRSESLSRSNSSSKSKRSNSGKTTPIGLGLPEALAHRASEGDINSAPKVQHTVSSPFPVSGRASSPVPRISFAESDGRASSARSRESSRDRSRSGDEKRRAKRVSSFSSVFKSGEQQANASKTSLVEPRGASVDPVPASKTGVLEWLGVRRAPRRRRSEGRLNDAAVDENRGRARASSAGTNQVLDDTAPDSQPETAHSSRTSSPVTMVRPQIPSVGSNASISTSTGGKFSSLFSRRASSKQGTSPGETPPLPDIAPSVTPTASLVRRGSGTLSSQASFTLPPLDPLTSPINIPHARISAEMTDGETEELLLAQTSPHWGPGVRPWMDGLDAAPRSARSSISTPLEMLPETNPLDVVAPPSLSAAKEGRPRAWSDAPVRSSPDEVAFPRSERSPYQPTEPSSLGPSPLTPPRPKLGARTNSANSAIIDRMKTVFARSTSRQRSNTVARPSATFNYEEFGVVSGGTRMRAESSSSSSMASPRLMSRAATLGSPAQPSADQGERVIFLDEPLSGSPRNSISASSYTNSPALSTTLPSRSKRMSRARASTISSGPPSSTFPPQSPNLYPVSATPPRRRPSVIHRISTGLLGTSPKPPGGLFPLPPRSSGSVSSVNTGGFGDEAASSALRLSTSPRQSTGSAVPSAPAPPVPDPDETPAEWLERVANKVSREELSGVLARKNDPFHAEALKIHMAQFDFLHLPLDVALRKLLLRVSLPKETQQIDRVVEAFASRYEECEPLLFGKADNTYILAFSMIMLHTDHFNAHNKNKMSKADYIKNTRLEGVHPTVLEVFYDNITATPFVFVGDEAESSRPLTASVLGLPGGMTPSSGSRSRANTISAFSSATSSSVVSTSKPVVDVYAMIASGALINLEEEVKRHFELDAELSTTGTLGFLHVERLHRAFANAKLVSADAGGTALGPKKKLSRLATPSRAPTPSLGPDAIEQIAIVKISRTLVQKLDAIESKKRKWRSQVAVLTAEQLLLYKDASPRMPNTDVIGGERPEVPLPDGKAEEVLNLKECVAVYDRSASLSNGHAARVGYTFRLVMPFGREWSCRLSDEAEMNDWINLVNYASAFRSAGIRMRNAAIGQAETALIGLAAAKAVRKAEKGPESARPQMHANGLSPRRPVFGDAPAMRRGASDTGRPRSAGISADRDEGGEAHSPASTGDQLAEVFGEVKLALSANRVNGHSPSQDASPAGQVSPQEARLRAIETRIATLDAALKKVDLSILASQRIARNLAILTPFLRATRDRVVASLPALSHQIKQDRLEHAKLSAWISVLRADVSRERKERARMRGAALQAAGMSLRDPKSPRAAGASPSKQSGEDRSQTDKDVDGNAKAPSATAGSEDPADYEIQSPHDDDTSDSPEDVEQPITPQDTPTVQPSVVRSGSSLRRRERAGSLGSRDSKRSSVGRPVTHRAASENLLKDEARPKEAEEDQSSDAEDDQGEAVSEDAGVKVALPA